MNYQFGSGKLITTSQSGNVIEIAVLEEAQVDFNVTTKKLPGPYRYALATADGEGDIKLTAKNVAFMANAFNLVWGGTSTFGSAQQPTFDEIGVVSGASTYNYVLAGGSSYVAKSAVVWFTPAGTGGVSRQLQLVAAGSEVSGVSYSETSGTGTLKFAAADAAGTVRVSYRTTTTTAVGQTIAISNPLQNNSLGVKASLMAQSLNRQNNKISTFILDLNNVIIPGMKLGFKSSDWTMPDFTAEVAADANNAIGTAYFVNYDGN